MRFAIVSALFLTGCACLPVPTTDVSPPTAGITVEYRPLGGGARVAKTLLPTDADISVEADKSDVISVLYTGGDAQGLRRIELDWELATWTGTSYTTTLGLAIDEEATCPKESLIGNHTFDPASTQVRYRLATRSHNWLGLTIRTGQITIVAK